MSLIKFNRKLKNSGVAMVGYAIMLAFVCSMGGVFLDDKSLSNGIDNVLIRTSKLLGQQGPLKSTIAGLEELFSFESVEGKLILASYNDFGVKGGKMDINGSIAASLAAAEIIKNMDTGGIEPVSWRLIHDVNHKDAAGNQFVKLIWSDVDWNKVNAPANVPCMVAELHLDSNGKFKNEAIYRVIQTGIAAPNDKSAQNTVTYEGKEYTNGNRLLVSGTNGDVYKGETATKYGAQPGGYIKYDGTNYTSNEHYTQGFVSDNISDAAALYKGYKENVWSKGKLQTEV